jgi:hypothetical protein
MTTLTAEVVEERVRDDLSSRIEVTNNNELTRQNFDWRIFEHHLNFSIETGFGMLIEMMAWHIWEDLSKEVRMWEQEALASGMRPPRAYNGEKIDKETAVNLLRTYIIFHGIVTLPANKFEALTLARKIVGYTDEDGKYHHGFRQSQAYLDTLEFYPPVKPIDFSINPRNFPEEYPHS